MRNTNKIATLLLAMSLLFLVGCGGSNSEAQSDPGPVDPGPSPVDPDPGDPSVPLTGPQQVQLTGVDGALQIRFTKVADAQNIEAEYNLRYGTSDDENSATELGTDVLQVSGMLVSGEIKGLINGITYYVWINAEFGNLGASTYHMETGIPVPTPLAPAVIYSAAGDTMVDLMWDPVDYAFSYEVAISTGTNPGAGSVVRKTMTEPRYMVTVGNLDGDPLTNGTAYNIWVRASNTNGTSDYSERITAIPVEASDAPVATDAPSITPGNKRLNITWNAVRWATHYNLYYNTSNNTATAVLANEIAPDSGTVSATIADLENGREYYVWVRAGNRHDLSSFSSAGSGIPQEVDVPVNFSDYGFQLGVAAGEFIFAEPRPFSPFVRGNSRGPWDRLTRTKETPLGNLFTDGVMWYLRDKYPDENVDFVFLNGGYIDNLIKKGPVSVSTVMGAVASTDREDDITLVSMKGSNIKALFDAAAGMTRTGVGTGNTADWAIVSKEVNLTYSYPFVDSTVMSIPNPPGLSTEDSELYYHGVIKPGTLKINGTDFEDETIYRIATTESIADGAAYLLMATEGFDRIDLPTTYWHAVAEYIYDTGSVTPAIDGRIRIEGGAPGGTLGVPEGYNQYCPTTSTYDEEAGCIF